MSFLIRIVPDKGKDGTPFTQQEIMAHVKAAPGIWNCNVVPSLSEGWSAKVATADKGYPHPGNVITLPDGGGAIHLQYGHPGEVGRNGCFTTDVIQGLIDNISVYQERGHPMATRETALAITHLETALMWINRRKEKRKQRDVHQTDKP